MYWFRRYLDTNSLYQQKFDYLKLENWANPAGWVVDLPVDLVLGQMGDYWYELGRPELHLSSFYAY